MFIAVKTKNIKYLESLSRYLFNMTNEARQSQGLNLLNFNKTLMESSWIQSFQMCKHGFFDHKNPYDKDTRDLEKRIQLASSRIANSDQTPFQLFGENIAEVWNYDPKFKELPSSMHQFISIFNMNEEALANHIFRGWMNSKPHRLNILNPRFNAMGVSAVARPGTGILQRDVIKFTQNFGELSFQRANMNNGGVTFW